MSVSDEPMTELAGGVIERELRIDAPPGIVFRFFTDPDRMARWMGRTITLDASPGGAYRIDYNGSDVASGTFLEVEEPHRIVFTWGWEAPGDPVQPGGSLVEVTLAADGAGTALRLRHSGLPTESVEGHAEGWDYFLPTLRGVAEINATTA
jgi:uncharacterized protein YndB with AHSA1/START domain